MTSQTFQLINGHRLRIKSREVFALADTSAGIKKKKWFPFMNLTNLYLKVMNMYLEIFFILSFQVKLS